MTSILFRNFKCKTENKEILVRWICGVHHPAAKLLYAWNWPGHQRYTASSKNHKELHVPSKMRLQLFQTYQFKSQTLSSLCSSPRGISEDAWGICTHLMLKTDRGDDWEKILPLLHWLVRTGVQHLRVATTHFFIFQAFCFCSGIYIFPPIGNLHRKTFFCSEEKASFPLPCRAGKHMPDI